MRINITGHHIDITDGLKSAVQNSFSKLLKHNPDITRIDVVLTVEKKQQMAESIIHFLGQDIVAKSSSDDLYLSISDLKVKMESLLKKRKATIRSKATRKPVNMSFKADLAVA